MEYPTNHHKKLFSAIRAIRNDAQARDFLRDLMTIGELDAIAERWHIARLLWTTTFSYKKIAKKTHASTTTITRVSHWLKHGTGGYRTILIRLFGARKRYADGAN